MTPELLKEIYDFAMTSYGLIAKMVEDEQKAHRPPSFEDKILDRVMSDLDNTPAASNPPEITQNPDGLWNVAGLKMLFSTQSDAVIAAAVMARVREAAQQEGRP